MVFPDNTSPKKLSGVDWLVGLRIVKLMPYANWDNTFCLLNLRKWIGGMCWRIAEPVVTTTAKVQKKAEKASKKKFLKSRNLELSFLFITKRIFFFINRMIKEKELTEGAFPKEYRVMIDRLYTFYRENKFLNPKGGTEIIGRLLQTPMTWQNFQYALLILRNITVKRSGAFTKIKQQLLKAQDEESRKALRQKLLEKCKTISEKAFLFEELPDKFCQNYETWMTGEEGMQKGDGELRRIAWAVCAEDRGDLEALIAKAEEITRCSLSIDSLAVPAEEVAPSEVVAAMAQQQMMLEGSSAAPRHSSSSEEKSSGSAVAVSVHPIDILKASILEANSADACSDSIISLSQVLTPEIAVELICKEYKMKPEELSSIFERLDIDRFDERLCEGILIALKTRDYDETIRQISHSL